MALGAAGLVLAVTALAAEPGAPTNTAPPETSGVLVRGERLTATQGAWDQSPTSFSYQWQRCDVGDAGSCTDIAGANDVLYVLASGDVGNAVRVEVVATNAAGPSDPAASALTEEIAPATAPSPEADPSIDGAAPPEVDDELTADPGTWSGQPAPTFTFQWLRCTGPAIGDCAPVPAATANTYTPVGADLGARLRVAVTATNVEATVGPVHSAATQIVGPSSRPVNTIAPVITGAPTVGQTLATSNGSWSAESALSFTYRWQRCDDQGGNCADIDGATQPTYALGPPDAGHRIVSVVTATDQASEDRSATSAPTEVVGTGPVNTARPAISGVASAGELLAAGTGGWEQGGTLTFSYQWRRCDALGQQCQNIPGATVQTYRVQSADLGRTLVVVVTARNQAGSTQSAASSPTGVVTGAQPGTTVPVSRVSLPDRLIVSSARFMPGVLRSRSPFTARFRVMDTQGHPVSGADVNLIVIPYGRVQPPGAVKTDSSGWATFVLRPTSKFPLIRGYLITMQARATKPGGSLLAGVSARRLVSVRISPR